MHELELIMNEAASKMTELTFANDKARAQILCSIEFNPIGSNLLKVFQKNGDQIANFHHFYTRFSVSAEPLNASANITHHMHIK